MTEVIVVNGSGLTMTAFHVDGATPSSDTMRTEHLVKRHQARENFSSILLKSRDGKGAFRLCRSLTDVSFGHPKNVETMVDHKEMFNAREADQGNPKQNHSSRHDIIAHSYHVADGSPSPPTGKRLPLRRKPHRAGTALTPLKDSRHHNAIRQDQLTQRLTISELRKLLNSKEGEKSVNSELNMPKYKGMTIHIQRAPEVYPNISLTIDKAPTSSSPHKQQINQRPEKVPVRPVTLPMLPRAPTTRKRTDAVTVTTDLSKWLKTTEAQRENPKEWTKNWIRNNPLGPEVNEEFEEESLKNPLEVKNTNTMLKEPHSGKKTRRVRFGSDEFLSADK